MTPQARPSLPLPLEHHFDSIRSRISDAPAVALYLDFDGTVSPIVSRPHEATLDPEIRRLLEQMLRRGEFHIAFVSGRELADLRRRVDLPDVIYAGDHGLEIEGRGAVFHEPRAEQLREQRVSMLRHLHSVFRATEGIEIENKNFSSSVHFRRAPGSLHDWVRNQVSTAVAGVDGLSVHFGKMVAEIRPDVQWNKGYAVRWIQEHLIHPPDALPVSLGDDTTDEDAFAALPDGITVRVGPPIESFARYMLADVPAVCRFLDWLYRVRSRSAIAQTTIAQ